MKEIYDSLALKQAGYTPRRQNVSVGMRVNGYDVDLVPAKRQNSYTTDHSLYRRRPDTWTKTNIDTHIATVRAAGQSDAIRILKLWRNQKGLEFPSFYLELTVINALAGRGGALAQRVAAALEYLRDRFENARLVDPANGANVISDDLTAAEKRAIRAAATAALCGPWEGTREVNGWSLERVLGGLHEIQQRLDRARGLGHAVAKGDASETIWIELLNRYLPERYRADRCFVVDSEGAF